MNLKANVLQWKWKGTNNFNVSTKLVIADNAVPTQFFLSFLSLSTDSRLICSLINHNFITWLSDTIFYYLKLKLKLISQSNYVILEQIIAREQASGSWKFHSIFLWFFFFFCLAKKWFLIRSEMQLLSHRHTNLT